MIPGLARGSVGPFSTPGGALEVLYGGTGGISPADAAKNLGVPTLDANNVFTGNNSFTATGGIFTNRVWTDGGLKFVTTDVFAFDAAGAVNYIEFLGTARTHSFPDASGVLANVGDPLKAPYVAKGALYTALTTDCVINCNGTFTVTLPTAVGVSGRMYFIKNSGAGVITVACNGAQTIDGAATAVLAAAAVARVCSDGANWILL